MVIMMNGSSTDLARKNLPRNLLLDPGLRQHQRDANREPTVLDVTHHGPPHRDVVWIITNQVGPIVRPDPEWQIRWQPVAETSAICHDKGLIDGRARHATNGAIWVPKLLAPFEPDPLDVRVAQCVTRFHRAETYNLVATQIVPNKRRIQRFANKRRSLARLIALDEHPLDDRPTKAEAVGFLRLMDENAPIMDIESLVVAADVVEMGRSRLRGRSHRLFEEYMPEAEARAGVSLYDVLQEHGIDCNPHDLAEFGMEETYLILANRAGEEILRICIQSVRGKYPHSRPDECVYGGAVAWARTIDNNSDDGWFDEVIVNPPSCVYRHPSWRSMTAATATLRLRASAEVCSREFIEYTKRFYLRAYATAFKHLGLEPRLDISMGMMF